MKLERRSKIMDSNMKWFSVDTFSREDTQVTEQFSLNDAIDWGESMFGLNFIRADEISEGDALIIFNMNREKIGLEPLKYL